MTTVTLALGHLLTLLEGLGYVLVAELLRRRAVSQEWRTPAAMFRAWWLLIGTNKIAAALMGHAWVSGLASEDAYVALLYVNLVVLCASLAALLGYFSFLLSGKTYWYYVVAAFYVTYYLVLTFHLASSQPSNVVAGEWRTYHMGNGEPAPAWRGLFVLLGLAVPQTVAALTYVGLAFRIHDRSGAYRIALVATSVLAWTTSILFVSLPLFNESAALQVGSRFVGMLGAACAVLAYRPPRAIGRWLHVHAITEAVHPRAAHRPGPNP